MAEQNQISGVKPPLKLVKANARINAEKRGHLLSQFIPYEGGLMAICKRCQKKAHIEGGAMVLRADDALTSICN